jgi:hypothetical protein
MLILSRAQRREVKETQQKNYSFKWSPSEQDLSGNLYIGGAQKETREMKKLFIKKRVLINFGMK